MPADEASRSERGGVCTSYAAQANDEDNEVSGHFYQFPDQGLTSTSTSTEYRLRQFVVYAI